MSYDSTMNAKISLSPQTAAALFITTTLFNLSKNVLCLVSSCSNWWLRGEEKSETLTVASQISDLIDKIQNGVVRGRIYNSFKSNFR